MYGSGIWIVFQFLCWKGSVSGLTLNHNVTCICCSISLDPLMVQYAISQCVIWKMDGKSTTHFSHDFIAQLTLTGTYNIYHNIYWIPLNQLQIFFSIGWLFLSLLGLPEDHVLCLRTSPKHNPMLYRFSFRPCCSVCKARRDRPVIWLATYSALCPTDKSSCIHLLETTLSLFLPYAA